MKFFVKCPLFCFATKAIGFSLDSPITLRQNTTQFEKKSCVFFKYGRSILFCATCTASGYPCFIIKPAVAICG